MPCAFELEYDLRETSGCQFLNQKLFDFAGKEWCQFHLPVEIKDKETGQVERSEKAAWKADRIKGFNQAVFRVLKAPRDEGEPADLSGVAFPGTIHITSGTVTATQEPVPLPSILFLNAVFCGDAGFNKTTFGDDTQFNGATFKGAAGFEGAVFKGIAGFEGAVFGDIAGFKGATFEGNARFAGATFGSGAEFNEATFHGNAGFIKARFEDDANFKATAFKDRTWFNKAIFRSDTWFEEARFKGHAGFEDAEFKCHAEFIRATFRGTSQFDRATFENDAEFQNTRFEQHAKFNGGSVKGEADFSCEASPKEENTDAFRQISFAGRKFHGKVKFTNRRFLDKTDFKGTVFEVAPEFHNCALHPDTDFSDPNFRDTKNDHAARAYRTLKLAMEQVRARGEEANFYALEQKSLRNRKDTPKWANRLSALYEITSDYGRSVLRPLGWLAGIQVPFFIVYCLIPPSIKGVPQDFLGVLRFTLAQVARPFMALSPGSGDGDKLPDGIALLAGLHSFLSLSLIALLLLALRWRFRRG